jgi:hypothetical protein
MPADTEARADLVKRLRASASILERRPRAAGLLLEAAAALESGLEPLPVDPPEDFINLVPGSTHWTYACAIVWKYVRRYGQPKATESDDIEAWVRGLPTEPTPALKAAFEFYKANMPQEPGERLARQRNIAEWCMAAFGVEQATSLPQRGVRLAEEAIEAAQAAGAPIDMLHKLVDYVYSRPKGTIAQELGGVGVTALALAAAAGVSADECEAAEVARVLAKPLEHFAKRNAEKNGAGFLAIDALPSPAQERGERRKGVSDRRTGSDLGSPARITRRPEDEGKCRGYTIEGTEVDRRRSPGGEG